MRKPVVILLVVALLAVLAAAGWWYASPWWTLRAMQDAAKQRDAAKLSAYVDYPALREDLKGDLRRYISTQVGPEVGAGSSFAATLAGAVVGPVVDATVNPDGVAAMFAEQNSGADRGQPTGKSAVVNASDHPVIERQGLNSFRVHGKDAAKGALVFHRSGLGWKLVGVDLPSDVRLSTH